MPPKKKSRFWLSLFNNTLRSKIGPVVKKLLKITTKLVFGPKDASNGSPEGKILVIDTVFQSRLNVIKKS